MVVFIAALGFTGLPFSAAGVTRNKHPASLQVVFVDKAELAKLHPGWQALNDMRTMLAGGSMPNARTTADRKLGFVSRGSVTGRSRSELAAKAARDMCAALDGLEARKYEALRVRREAMRSQLMKSAEADWKADARGIEETAAAETKHIDEQNKIDLVNARLREAASEVEFKVSQKSDSGMSKDLADAKLLQAKNELASVESADEAKKRRVMALAGAKIDILKQVAAKRIEEQVGAYESEQNKLIAESMATARAEIAQKLGPASTPALFSGRCKAGANNTVDLCAAVSALQMRIDKDVSSMVHELSVMKGLKVTFERRGANTKDATKIFASLIKKYGWNARASLMSGLGSS